MLKKTLEKKLVKDNFVVLNLNYLKGFNLKINFIEYDKSNNQYFVLIPSERNHQFSKSLLKINCIKICDNTIFSKNY